MFANLISESTIQNIKSILTTQKKKKKKSTQLTYTVGKRF